MARSDDYFEWDVEFAKAARARASERLRIADLYDSEIRLRVGETIARAMQQANKKREP